jgi:hypothetical protein
MRNNFYLHRKIVKRFAIFATLFLSMTSLSVIHIQAAVQNIPLSDFVNKQSNPILVISLSVISAIISLFLLSVLKNKNRINS